MSAAWWLLVTLPAGIVLAACQAVPEKVAASTATLSPMPVSTFPATPSPSPTASRTPTITPSPTSSRTPAPSPTPPGGAKAIVFEGLFCEGEKCDWPAIYFYNFQSGDSRMIAGKGQKLFGISPDGQSILAADYADLYTMRIGSGESHLLTQNLLAGSENPAYWDSNGKIIFLWADISGLFVYKVNLDGSNLAKITPRVYAPLILYPSYDGSGVHWGNFDAQNRRMAYGYAYQNWWTSLDGRNSKLTRMFQPVFSPDGRLVAYHNLRTNPGSTHRSELYIADAGNPDKRIVTQLSGMDFKNFESYLWSPDGKRLLVTVETACGLDGCEKKHYIVSADGAIEKEFQPPADYDFNTRFFWCPDGRSLYFKTASHIFMYDVDRDYLTDLTGKVPWSHFIRDVYWITQ